MAHTPSFGEAYRAGGLRGVLRAAVTQVADRATRTQPHDHDTTHIYDEDWDILVVLSGCRFDHMVDVQQHHDFINSVDPTYTTATTPDSWLQTTFNKDNIADTARTAYITGDPRTEHRLDQSQFLLLDEVWRYAWDNDIKTIRPRPLTDRAIRVWRDRNPDRMIVHYMQPEPPFFNHNDLVTDDATPAARHDVWSAMQAGALSDEAVDEAYKTNLNAVLNHVEILLNAVDAEDVVLTSNHGTALGEGWLYGYPTDAGLRHARQVPWVRTTAEETMYYDPDITTPLDEAERIDAFFDERDN